MYKTATLANRSKKPFIIFAIVLIVLALVAVSYWMYVRNTSATERSSATSPTINNGPPTPEEVKAGDTQKATNVDREATKTAPAPASSLDLRITDAAQYADTIEVRAYVTNNYEGGTCTTTFTKPSQITVTTTSTAFKDASTTQCGANDTPHSKFSVAGDWQMTLEYKSVSGKTGTATKMVTIK